jgi:hypothetical protein
MRFLLLLAVLLVGCSKTEPYGTEQKLTFPGVRAQTWAVAPAVNLSGRRAVDALLQADLVFEEVSQITGVTAVPVNRVAEVYASLNIATVESPEEAALVCELLGVDALLVPTVTLYDPYDPPKLGASLQLFGRKPITDNAVALDTRSLSRTATVSETTVYVEPPEFVQAAGVFDATDGTTRQRLMRYAAGRNDPDGPMTERAYFMDMDAFSSFAYHALLEDLLNTPSSGG